MIDEAEGDLNDFELSDEGYILSWNYVISRFEKRRSIVKVFFRNLYRSEAINNEGGLQKLLASVNDKIRDLQIAGE